MKNRLRIPDILAILFSAAAYFFLAYFTPRTSFYQLLILFLVLFAGYAWLLKSSFSFKTGLLLTLGFRLVFIAAYPRLSDDYFRFIWDGNLLAAGINPFLHLPSYFIQETTIAVPGINESLFSRLNSPHYFSVYPPVCQGIFWCASYISGANNWLTVVIMRLFILAAEAGTLIILFKLLQVAGLPEKRIWWYGFNPLIIVELTGNLHFEALVVFFLLGSIYLLFRGQNMLSAVSLGLAVGVKLLPLMLLPVLWRYLGTKAFMRYGAVVLALVFLLFLPFLSATFLQNIFNSLDLYFQKFEFNASVYYVLRWFGYKFYGYNQIANLGPMLSLVTLGGILYVTSQVQKRNKKQLQLAFLAAFTLYFLLATVVHPWYLTTLVALCVLTGWRYPLVWSGLCILSYAAYQNQTYTENNYLITLEYIGVLGAFIFEWWRRKKQRVVESNMM